MIFRFEAPGCHCPFCIDSPDGAGLRAAEPVTRRKAAAAHAPLQRGGRFLRGLPRDQSSQRHALLGWVDGTRGQAGTGGWRLPTPVACSKALANCSTPRSSR